uniref:restriction endonuclease subunit S n=1 Tax=Segatella copri TaxID=165179 RepID=UPI0035636FDA
MNGKQLKNSILQWAIQGKLVPQDPNDEPASVLLEKIRQEKERLIKEKKIKRDKNASIIYRGEDNSYYEKMLATGEVKCIDEEVPFEIPQGWEWCRLNEVATSVTDFVASGSFASLRENVKYYSTKEYALLVRTKDLSCNFSNDLVYTDKHGYDFLSNSNLFGGELILPNIGASIGKVFIVPDLNMPMTLAPNSVMIRLDDECTKSWLYNVFSSPFGYDTLWSISSSTAQGKFNKTDFRKVLVPIPPIEEQNRIVTKIKELSPYIEKYSKAQEHLDVWNVAIKEILQKSILQEAIQGKLVPQIAEEGTAQELLEHVKAEKQKLVKEGKLKKSALNDSVIFHGDDNRYYEKIGEDTVCIDDEIPFDIPANWVWIRLDDICSFIHRGKSPKYSLIKKYPVVAQKCNQWSGFSIEKAKFIEPQSISSYKEEYILQDEDLMWNSTGLGTLGRMAIYNKKLNPYELAVADSHVTVIRPYKQYVVSEYLYYYFASNTVQSVIEDKSDGSTKQKELSTKTVKSYLVPLPPMEEQMRIVEKVEELTQLLK